jgi:hypothetical protein
MLLPLVLPEVGGPPPHGQDQIIVKQAGLAPVEVDRALFVIDVGDLTHKNPGIFLAA